MYELLDKDSVLAELDTEVYIVDFSTLRCMACADMKLSSIKFFIDKPDTLFFKKVANE